MKAQTCDMAQDTVNTWTPRSQQSFPAEAFAALAAIIEHSDLLANKDVTWFVDMGEPAVR